MKVQIVSGKLRGFGRSCAPVYTKEEPVEKDLQIGTSPGTKR